MGGGGGLKGKTGHESDPTITRVVSTEVGFCIRVMEKHKKLPLNCIFKKRGRSRPSAHAQRGINA
jgi:hypothetical protein